MKKGLRYAALAMTIETTINIFYKYTPIAQPEHFREWLKGVCTALELRGRIIVASEGINGTLEGAAEAIAQFERTLHAQNGVPSTYGDFSDVWFKHSPGTGVAFPRLSVRVRPEIVTLRAPQKIDPNKVTGTHISADELHEMFENDEDFVIIDMRNDYEHRVGHFEKSVEPGTENFYELPEKLDNLAHLKDKKVVTVCTYGVRCEKASGLLKKNGFKDVSQLHGGIGTYMQKYPGKHFRGSLYVFDQRLREQFTDSYEVIAECARCGVKSEHIVNCANDLCHKQHLQCEACIEEVGAPFCNAQCAQQATQAEGTTVA